MAAKTASSRIDVLGTGLEKGKNVPVHEVVRVAVEGGDSDNEFGCRQVGRDVIVSIPVSNADFDWSRTPLHAELITSNGEEIAVYYPYMSGITALIWEFETGEWRREEFGEMKVDKDEEIVWKRN